MNRWIVVWIVLGLAVVWPSLAGGQTDGNTSSSTVPVPSLSNSNSNSDSNIFAHDAGLTRGMFVRVLVGLVVVIALAVSVLLLGKRVLGRIGQGPGQRIRIKETCALGPRKALHWVEAGGQRFLIASTPDRVVLLSELLGDSVWEESESYEEDA